MRVEPITPIQHRKNFQKMPFNQLYAIYKKRGNQHKPKSKRELLDLICDYYA